VRQDAFPEQDALLVGRVKAGDHGFFEVGGFEAFLLFELEGEYLRNDALVQEVVFAVAVQAASCGPGFEQGCDERGGMGVGFDVFVRGEISGGFLEVAPGGTGMGLIGGIVVEAVVHVIMKELVHGDGL